MKNNENVTQMIKFFLFSCSAGIVQSLSFALLDSVLKVGYWPSYLTGLVLSVIWNFTLNRKFTFKSAGNVPKAMLLVLCYYAVFTPVSTYIGQICADDGVNHYLILFVTMAANMITEFIFDKYVVFRKEK